MSAELIGILSVGVALAALHMASMRSLREEIGKEIHRLDARLDRLETRLDRLETRLDGMESRLDSLEQRMARLEGVLDGLREALFGRAREAAQ